ncbi:MAG: methyltransferase domain-containing protein [Magnetococcales bacterium]|nr:methyltransferase domain-containing protein [Magnetococcales bacterium]
MHCRLCGYDNITMFLDLGFTALADRFITREQLHEPEVTYPLRVVRCNECHFIQLDHTVAPEILYQQDYPYESSTTQTGREHFNQFARSIVEEFGFSKGSLAIDIGSNVGVLLGGFKNQGMRVLGIDPAINIARIAEKNGIPTIADFFNEELASRIAEEHGKAMAITASNVFAHIDRLDILMRGVRRLLHEDGIFVVEAPYLRNLIRVLEYDTIYHEHLSYLSISPLIRFFDRMGMALFDVKEVDIHGGSFRLFVCHKGRYPVLTKVLDMQRQEQEEKLHDLETLNTFAQRVRNHRNQLRHLLESLRHEGKRIAGVSAPAKGMTLLNYCRIGTETLEFITEKTPLKIGRYAPGNSLPILPDSALMTGNIDYALLLAWNFKDEIMNNLSEFRKKGGRFIIPIPNPVIV